MQKTSEVHQTEDQSDFEYINQLFLSREGRKNPEVMKVEIEKECGKGGGGEEGVCNLKGRNRGNLGGLKLSKTLVCAVAGSFDHQYRVSVGLSRELVAQASHILQHLVQEPHLDTN